MADSPTITPVQTGDQRIDRFESNVASAVNPVLRLGAKKLQGRDLSATAPTDGQVLAWSKADGEWEPQTVGGGTVPGVTAVTASAPLASSGGATPNLTLTNPLPIANGGTNSTAITEGATSGADVAISDGASFGRLSHAKNTVLTSDSGNSLGFRAVDLPTQVSGLLPDANLPGVGTPGTYGDATHVAQVTTDAQGRVSAASAVAISFPASGGPKRPALNGDELLVYRCNDASSPLVNSGSAASADLTAVGTPAAYSVPGPFATAAVASFAINDTTDGWTGAAAVVIPDAFTLSAWFYQYENGGTSHQTIFSKLSGANYGVILFVNESTGFPEVILTTSGATNHALSAIQPFTTPIAAPHFVAVTYTSGALKIYVDGELANSDATTGTMSNDNTKKIAVGAGDGINQALVGKIWEVRLNSSVLPQATLRQWYAAGMGWQS